MYREIEIVGSLAAHRVRPGTACRFGAVEVPAEHMVSAPAILAAIDEAEAAGKRVLLLVVESEGGNALAGFQVYNRVAAFQRSGGRVVAFVRGRVGSMMPVIVEGADYVVMAGDARFIMHGALGAPAAEVARVNEACVLALAARTGEPLETLRFLTAEVMRPGGDWAIRPDYAIPHGWADRVGTLEDARQLAAELAEGRTPDPTARSSFLAGATPEPVNLRPLGLAAEIAAHQQQSSESSFNSSAAAAFSNLRVRERLASLRNWTQRAITAGHYEAVIWHVDHWVAAGSGNPTGNACSTSTDGAVWTARTIGIAPLSLATNGTRIVAVGASCAATSDDGGQTWTTRTIPVGTYERVVFANGLWVAVGLAQACAISSDGATWTAKTLPAGPYTPNNYVDVAWNGTVWCAVGSYADCATSPDASTWTFRSGLAAALPTYNHAGCIAVAGPRFVVLAESALLAAYSDDNGVTWSSRSVPSPGAGTRDMTSLILVGEILAGFDRNGVGGSVYLDHDFGTLWTVTPGLPGYLASRGAAWNGTFACLVGWQNFCATSGAV